MQMWLVLQVLLLLDADFLVSKGVHEALTALDKASALMEDLTANKKVIVLPAFETPRSLSEEEGREYALQAQSSECPTQLCNLRVRNGFCMKPARPKRCRLLITSGSDRILKGGSVTKRCQDQIQAMRY